MEIIMVYMLIAITAILILLFFYQLITERWGEEKYPVGPYCLPVIGNMLQLLCNYKRIDLFFNKCRKRFGDVFTVALGGSSLVIISGYDVMYRLLVEQSHLTSTRTTRVFGESFTEYSAGLLWAPEPHWRWLRDFVATSLSRDNLEVISMEQKIYEEINHYIHYYIQPTVGTPVNNCLTMSHAIFNINNVLVTGSRINYNDESFYKLHNAVVSEKSSRMSKVMSLLSNTPLLSYFLSQYLRTLENGKEEPLKEFLRSQLLQHKESGRKERPNDLMDFYLIKRDKLRSMKDRAPKHCFSENTSIYMMFHLYLTGTETTALAINWTLLYLCMHPHVQRKVHKEIDKTIGSERVSTSDHMPYMRAVIAETLRRANIMPVGFTHTTTREMTIHGRVIPAESDLLFNMASVLHGDAVLSEPLVFNPDRYLQDVMSHKCRTLPFGIGPRACVGEYLANTEIFIALVSILQRYTVHLHIDCDTRTILEPLSSFYSHPKEHKIVFTERTITPPIITIDGIYC